MSSQLFLLRELVKRDFQSRYAGSVLGFLWPFLQPLWQLLLFSFVFATVMKIPIVGERTEHFAVFLFCGLLPWLALQEGVMRSATAITENANLVKNIHFRPEILVLAVVLGGLLHQAIATVVFLAVLFLTGEFAWQGLPLLVLILPLQIGLTLGLGLLVCSIHTIFRDTAQILSMILSGWFYFTPIVYPLNLVPDRYVPWLEWNPLTVLVGLYRQAFLGGSWRPEHSVGKLVLATVVVLGVGWWFFQRSSRGFVDEV